MRKNFVCWTHDLKADGYNFLNSEKKIEFNKLHQFSLSINSAYAIFNSQLLAWTPRTENIYDDSLDFLQLPPIKFDNFGAQKVAQIFCNNAICHLITEEGLLYSWGADKDKTGILGLGDVYSQPLPVLNCNFKGKRMIDMSISEKHCVAIDITHKVYSWGTGLCGELGLLTITRTAVPLAVSLEKKMLLKTIKCGPSYTLMIDYNLTPYYFGVIGGIMGQLNEEDGAFGSIKIFPFDNSRCIDQVHCGNELVSLIDLKGILYLFSDKEGLNRVKIELPIKSIKFIDSSLYALTKGDCFIYEFTSKRNSKYLEDYYENVYSINSQYNKVNLIDTPYYNKALFFYLECTDKAKALAMNKQERIFNKVTQRSFISITSTSIGSNEYYFNNRYASTTKHSDSIVKLSLNSNLIESNCNYLDNNNEFLSFQCQFGPKTLINQAKNIHSYDKSLLMVNLKTDSRINRISSLLGRIFDKKIENIMKQQSNSKSNFFFIGRKKIELERIVPCGSTGKGEGVVTENMSQRMHKRASSYTARDCELNIDSNNKGRMMRISSQDKCKDNSSLNKVLIRVKEEDSLCSESITNDAQVCNGNEKKGENKAKVNEAIDNEKKYIPKENGRQHSQQQSNSPKCKEEKNDVLLLNKWKDKGRIERLLSNFKLDQIGSNENRCIHTVKIEPKAHKDYWHQDNMTPLSLKSGDLQVRPNIQVDEEINHDNSSKRKSKGKETNQEKELSTNKIDDILKESIKEDIKDIANQAVQIDHQLTADKELINKETDKTKVFNSKSSVGSNDNSLINVYLKEEANPQSRNENHHLIFSPHLNKENQLNNDLKLNDNPQRGGSSAIINQADKSNPSYDNNHELIDIPLTKELKDKANFKVKASNSAFDSQIIQVRKGTEEKAKEETKGERTATDRAQTTKLEIGKLFEKNVRIAFYSHQKSSYTSTEGNNQLNDNSPLRLHPLQDDKTSQRKCRASKRQNNGAKELFIQGNTPDNRTNEYQKQSEESKRIVHLKDDDVNERIASLENKSPFVKAVNELFNDHHCQISLSNSISVMESNTKMMIVTNNHFNTQQLAMNKKTDNKEDNDEKIQNCFTEARPVSPASPLIYKKTNSSDTQCFQLTMMPSLSLVKDNSEKEEEEVFDSNSRAQIYKKPIQPIKPKLKVQQKHISVFPEQQIIHLPIDQPKQSIAFIAEVVISDSITPSSHQRDRHSLINPINISNKDSKDDSELKEALFSIEDISNNNSTKRQSQNEISSPSLNKRYGNDFSSLCQSNKNSCSAYQIERISLPSYSNKALKPNIKDNDKEKPKAPEASRNINHRNKTSITEIGTNTDMNIREMTQEQFAQLTDTCKSALQEKGVNAVIKAQESKWKHSAKHKPKRKYISKNASTSNIMSSHTKTISNFKRSSSMAMFRSMRSNELASMISHTTSHNHNTLLRAKQKGCSNKILQDNKDVNPNAITRTNSTQKERKDLICASTDKLAVDNNRKDRGEIYHDIITPIKILNIKATKKKFKEKGDNRFDSKPKGKPQKPKKELLMVITDEIKSKNPKQFREHPSMVNQYTNHRIKTNHSTLTSGQLPNTNENKNKSSVAKKKDKVKANHRRQKSQNEVLSFSSSLTQEKLFLLSHPHFIRPGSSNEILKKNEKPKLLQASIENLREQDKGYLDTLYFHNQQLFCNQLVSDDKNNAHATNFLLSDVDHHVRMKSNKVMSFKHFNRKGSCNEIIPGFIKDSSLISLEYDHMKSESSVYEPIELEKSNRSSFIGEFEKKKNVSLTEGSTRRTPNLNVP